MALQCYCVTAAGLYCRLRFTFTQGSLRSVALSSETGAGAESLLCDGELPISSLWNSAEGSVYTAVHI